MKTQKTAMSINFVVTLVITICLFSTILQANSVVNTPLSKNTDEFHIVIQRQESKDMQREGENFRAIIGTISVNGEEIGSTMERDDLRIGAGSYKGLLRYWSKRGFAQGSFGTYGHEGDFLLEIANVGKRTDLLFHGGNKPWHSKGCILLGAVDKDKEFNTNIPYLNENHTLIKLRRLFYGTDVPDSTPDKNITITIIDIPEEKEQEVNPNAQCISGKCKKYKDLFKALKSYEEQVLKPCEVLQAGSQQYLTCMDTANKKYAARQREVDAIFEGDENGLLECSESADDAPACGTPAKKKP